MKKQDQRLRSWITCIFSIPTRSRPLLLFLLDLLLNKIKRALHLPRTSLDRDQPVRRSRCVHSSFADLDVCSAGKSEAHEGRILLTTGTF